VNQIQGPFRGPSEEEQEVGPEARLTDRHKASIWQTGQETGTPKA